MLIGLTLRKSHSNVFESTNLYNRKKMRCITKLKSNLQYVRAKSEEHDGSPDSDNGENEKANRTGVKLDRSKNVISLGIDATKKDFKKVEFMYISNRIKKSRRDVIRMLCECYK